MHLKDLKAGLGTIYDVSKVRSGAFQEVGYEILDFKPIMEIASANGVTQFHVERDGSPIQLPVAAKAPGMFVASGSLKKAVAPSLRMIVQRFTNLAKHSRN